MCTSGVRDDGGVLSFGAIGEGVERVAARGLRSGFSPHSHDSYVLGITVAGEQRFGYRRCERRALPGEAFILHPDETHDGRPGTAAGYGYLALYVAPRLIAEAAGHRVLPFVGEAVTRDGALRATLARAMAGDLNADELVGDLAAILMRLCGRPPPDPSPCYAALERIRQRLHEEWRVGIPLATLEAEHGMSRYTIARAFRRHFGVSPSRYVLLRRLDHARAMIAGGASLADAAYASGFADQSHMSRRFHKAFGLPPGVWRTAVRPPTDARRGATIG